MVAADETKDAEKKMDAPRLRDKPRAKSCRFHIQLYLKSFGLYAVLFADGESHTLYENPSAVSSIEGFMYGRLKDFFFFFLSGNCILDHAETNYRHSRLFAKGSLH